MKGVIIFVLLCSVAFAACSDAGGCDAKVCMRACQIIGKYGGYCELDTCACANTAEELAERMPKEKPAGRCSPVMCVRACQLIGKSGGVCDILDSCQCIA